MWAHTTMLRGKAECERYLKVIQRLHLPVKPSQGVRPKRIRPTQTSPDISHP